MDNPFSESEEKVVLFPSIRPNVCIIHVGQVGTEGTCRIDGNPGFDQYAAFASDKVIITAEEIVPEELLRQDPNRNYIPCTQVDMIVHVPWGAHPTLNPGYYDLDMEFIMRYQKAAETEEGFQAWADEWIYQIKDHYQYLEKLGVRRLHNLTAVKPFGFRPRVSVQDFVAMMRRG